MNIESLLNKIKIFKELVIDSGFKRDVVDNKQAISQAQNQNLVFMKGLSENIKKNFVYFENNSLDSELSIVLRENKPFTSLNTLEELEELDSNKEIDGQQYFQKFNSILNQLQNSIQKNESELNNLKTTFDKYVSEDDEYETDEEQAIMSLIFKDLESTGSLKEFSKVLNRWNRTLLIYHTLLKSESPKEISLVEIQNGSIDVIFNIDFDIAIDLTELVKTGLRVYGAYLLYKSKTAKEIIASYMGNKKLIATEIEREKLMLDNIKESIKLKALEQHEANLKSDLPPSKTGATKKADEVAKVITDHVVKGNEVKLLTPPEPEVENEQDISTELRTETATVRERSKKLDEKEKQLLLDKYTIKDEEEKKEE
ncbi:hypothetical protein [Aquimarina celericrescens]|uniref:Coiled-coil protein n=1 Tax=Aquimarina celericrescens TaxID=1964542 RepID=A0ABW5AWU1_9FLAO|nr:hypothetical protein [Aquimarina celericrescens]